MKRFVALFVLLALAVPVYAGKRRAAWDDPNAAGVVTGYCLYYGTQQGGPYPNKVDVAPGQREVTLTLGPGTYYFVVTAVNAEGQSPYSNEASTVVQPLPATQQNLTIQIIQP
ncbi:MAG TPA: fibronectin type III domain-containing protein [Salinarimonas sp.]|nr:fibronectin type III domain-containing protein [Salinarimonas sp.]